MDDLESFLSEKKIIIASYTHLQNGIPTTIGGSGIALREYLKSRVRKLMCIWQPMPLSDTLSVKVEIFVDNKLFKTKILPIPNWPFGRKKAISLIYFLLKMRDVLAVIFFVLFSRERFDIFIGVEALNASLGVILARLGLINKVIYFNLDYGAHRFTNSFLNFVFHGLDKFAVYHSNYTWCLSQVMIEGRKKRGFAQERVSPQIVVPIGVNFFKINRLPIEAIDKRCIVYLGLLAEQQGVNLIFEALPDIVKAIPDIKLIVIGTGPLELKLKSVAKECGLEKHVEFTGLISDKEVENILCRCAIGIAPFLDDPHSNKRFTEPTKPKTYLGCGLPVVITRVPPIALEIERRKAGVAIAYDKKELVQAVTALLTDEQRYQEYRSNAIAFAAQYDWNAIFDKSFGHVASRN